MFNVNKATAKVLWKNKISFMKEVDIFKEPKSKQKGDKELTGVLGMVMKHWVAITRIAGTDHGVFLDDAVSIKILDFLRELGD